MANYERSRLLVFILVLIIVPLIAEADVADVLGRYVGYTIVASKTIAGYVDKDGTRKNQFDGCNFGRTIIFDDNTSMTCSTYGYQYAFRPTAIILMKSMSIGGKSYGSVVMVVESDSYDMQGVILN